MNASLVLLSCFLAAAPRGAPAKNAAPAVRPLVVLMDGGATLTPEFRAGLLGAVQREVERSAGYSWMEPPAISLDELALALNCTGVDDACLRNAGVSLKAEAVLLVAVGKGPRREVVVSLVTVTTRQPGKMAAVPLQENAATLGDVAQAVRSLLGPQKPTRLAVVTDPPGAQVSVDGKPAGVTPFAVNDLPEGRHQVAVTLADFAPQVTDVELRPGESQEVRVTLKKKEAAPPPAPVAARPAPPPASPAPAAQPAPQPAPAQAAQPARQDVSSESASARPGWVRWITVVPGVAGLGLGFLGGVAGLVSLVAAYPFYLVLGLVNAATYNCSTSTDGTTCTSSLPVVSGFGVTQRTAWTGMYGLLGGGAVLALAGLLVTLVSVAVVASSAVVALVVL